MGPEPAQAYVNTPPNMHPNIQLQNDISDLFRSQQKSPTPVSKGINYIPSSPDALFANSPQIAKNTNNLRNGNFEQLEQLRAIAIPKGPKKRILVESPEKEASNEAKISKITKIRERVEFALGQLRQELPGQENAINSSLLYIRKACGESIEDPIQQQINLLQGQINGKLDTILQKVDQKAQNFDFGSHSTEFGSNPTQFAKNRQSGQNSQIPTQKPTYAQKAAQNGGISNPTEWKLVTKKPSPKPEVPYRERRLIVTPKTNNWTINAMKMRNSVNDALKNAKIDLLVATVAKTQRGNNIVVTVSEKYTAEALLAQKAIWEHVFDAKTIKKDVKWHKIAIHGLETEIFNTETGMEQLKSELELFNPGVKLITTPMWMSTRENRSMKRHASAILAFGSEKEATKQLSKRLLAAGSTYRTSDYRDYKPNDQCQKCQTFGHLQNKCNKAPKCQYCGQNHLTWDHKCRLPICIEKQPCSHMIPRCSNCQRSHFANNSICESYQAAQPISSNRDHLAMEL